ncbi:YaeQ family protein [Corallincola platygyrae]|uniref:YaeQ family protein n=1 Tax=Corallincola platygyrae TaxID=1193278 RepID=A0ABW4XJJ8_9GAMM
MSDKTLVHKLHADVSLEDEGRYYKCHTTLSLDHMEVTDHLYLRLLAFALFHEAELRFSHHLDSAELPDIYTDDAALGVVLGITGEHRIKRLINTYQTFHLLMFDDEVTDDAFKPHHYQGADVWVIERALVKALEDEELLNHRWSLDLSDGVLNISTAEGHYSGRFSLLDTNFVSGSGALHLPR